MTPTGSYREIFASWPESLPRRGVLINNLNEAVTFKAFMIKQDLLLLERQAPDAMGGRFVVLGFDTISSLKFVDPLKAESFMAFGFEGRLSLA